MPEHEDMLALSAALRALATANKSLRLYPASSPIPRESVASALGALAQFFADCEPRLILAVGREGLAWHGENVVVGSASMNELVQSLRDHAIARVDISDGVTDEEIISFLSALASTQDEVRDQGGLAQLLAGLGIRSIAISEIQLVTTDQGAAFEFEDTDDFLRDLIADPERLAAWFGGAAVGDPAMFSEALLELVRVAGPSSYRDLLGGLANAFCVQSADAKDGLLALALDNGPVRDVTADMFTFLPSGDIAGSVLEGIFGRNMLSLSNALSKLPLEQVTSEVRAEVQAMLPTMGHTSDEADFLDHMIAVRDAAEPEVPLVETDRSYQAVADVANLPDETVDKARSAVIGSTKVLSVVGVRTMLTILDQQQDFNLYCRTAESLAAMVPRLIAQGDVKLAGQILTELSNRERMESSPWPDLSARMASVRASAVGPSTMAALLAGVIADESLAEEAAAFVRHAGEDGIRSLVAEAVTLKGPGLDVAEKLVGRRMVDALSDVALTAEWFQLAPIAERLVAEDDPRSIATVDALMRRPDPQSRREVITGAAAHGGPRSLELCMQALGDSSPEVAIAATRCLAKSSHPSAGARIGQRLGELDLDSADYAVAREMIVALAYLPGREADEALAKIAGRRTLIKRGHFGEVQDLVAKTQRLREGAQGTA